MHKLELTLIPLHHGELPLPSVSVLPLSKESRGGGMEHASLALPAAETYQVGAAERVMILPRGGRTTFVVGMGGDE